MYFYLIQIKAPSYEVLVLSYFLEDEVLVILFKGYLITELRLYLPIISAALIDCHSRLKSSPPVPPAGAGSKSGLPPSLSSLSVQRRWAIAFEKHKC